MAGAIAKQSRSPVIYPVTVIANGKPCLCLASSTICLTKDANAAYACLHFPARTKFKVPDVAG